MTSVKFYTRASHCLIVSVSVSHQTHPLFYHIRQLHHVCRVDAEEDVKDFRPLHPGLDPPEIVVLFLCPERAFHHSRPHSGKFLSDKVFLLFLLTERTASFYERCLYPVHLAVVPVFSSRVASVASDIFRFAPNSFLCIFRNIRATFPSGVKNDLNPSFGLTLFLTIPKLSAISRRGSSFFILPKSLFSKVE